MTDEFIRRVTGCRRCPRLVDYLAMVAPAKGRSRQDYWNKPVPGFGDMKARVCLVGLAPGAHGANRTGRPFTGDGAGDFMYPLLHRAGFSNRPQVEDLQDGLELRDLYITNAVKCVPPENKPQHLEYQNCLPYLEEEFSALENLRVVLLLGQGAYNSYLRLLKSRGEIRSLSEHPFAHGACFQPNVNGPHVLASYHTSRYNVQTGRINPQMFLELLSKARELAGII